MARKPHLAFIGDLTVDKYIDSGEVRLGGAALNGAMWAKRLGAKASLFTALGTDKSAELFIEKIASEKINGGGIQKIEGETSSIEIHVNTHGERTYGTWNPGTLAKYHVRGMDILDMKKQDAIAVTVYPAYIHVLDELRSIQKMVRNKPLLIINFGDLVEFHSDFSIVEEYVKLADICTFGLNKDVDGDLINKLRFLAKQSGSHMLITLASYGSILYTRNASYQQSAIDVPVVDTTGGGDAFLSGFLVEYCTHHDIQSALLEGTSVASKAITQFGAY